MRIIVSPLCRRSPRVHRETWSRRARKLLDRGQGLSALGDKEHDARDVSDRHENRDTSQPEADGRIAGDESNPSESRISLGDGGLDLLSKGAKVRGYVVAQQNKDHCRSRVETNDYTRQPSVQFVAQKRAGDEKRKDD
jgi:hypothetical protein